MYERKMSTRERFIANAQNIEVIEVRLAEVEELKRKLEEYKKLEKELFCELYGVHVEDLKGVSYEL